MLVLETGRKSIIGHVAFAPDGRALAAVSDAGAYLWTEITDRARAQHLRGAFRYSGARFTPDGRWLFTGESDLYRIDPRTGTSAVLRLWSGYTTKFDVSPSEPLVLIAQILRTSENLFTRMGLWRADDLSPEGKVWERDIPGFNYYPPQFLAGGGRFARVEYVGDQDHTGPRYVATTYDTATGGPVSATPVAINSPYEWLLAPDGNLLVIRGTTQIDLLHLDAPYTSLVRFRNDSRRYFTGIALHPSGRFLAATSNDHTVKLFDVTGGSAERSLFWQLGRMRCIAFSPDGTLAAAGSDKGTVVVWDVDV